MDTEQAVLVIRQTVLDTTDSRRLAEFYRQLFGLRYCPGDEPPGPGQPDPARQDWLILTSPAGGAALAFQKGRGAARGNVAGRPGAAAVAPGRHGAHHG